MGSVVAVESVDEPGNTGADPQLDTGSGGIDRFEEKSTVIS
ncbi:hypothetical protein [Streptacidiphilus sp. MAP5-3]